MKKEEIKWFSNHFYLSKRNLPTFFLTPEELIKLICELKESDFEKYSNINTILKPFFYSFKKDEKNVSKFNLLMTQLHFSWLVEAKEEEQYNLITQLNLFAKLLNIYFDIQKKKRFENNLESVLKELDISKEKKLRIPASYICERNKEKKVFYNIVKINEYCKDFFNLDDFNFESDQSVNNLIKCFEKKIDNYNNYSRIYKWQTKAVEFAKCKVLPILYSMDANTTVLIF